MQKVIIDAAIDFNMSDPSKKDTVALENQEKVHKEYNAASYGLLYITHAYNEGKISFNEWIEQSREWAEAIIRQNDKHKLSKEK